MWMILIIYWYWQVEFQVLQRCLFYKILLMGNDDMKVVLILIIVVIGVVVFLGCVFGGGSNVECCVVEEIVGGFNLYLWWVSLDMLDLFLFVVVDLYGGIIIYDW